METSPLSVSLLRWVLLQHLCFWQTLTRVSILLSAVSDGTNADEYLFATQQECCDKWYSYADDCVASVGGPSADASAEKFYPVYGSGPDGGFCLKKTVGEFASYEQERYDSLAECCEAKYSHNMEKCCNAPDMGGCGSTNTVYLPDYYSNVCLPRAESALANFEKEFARESLSACCGDFFFWEAANSVCLEGST